MELAKFECDVGERHGLAIGPEQCDRARDRGPADIGFVVDERDPRRVALVATLDNLAKGAASQALQNLNLALGLDEFTGLTV